MIIAKNRQLRNAEDFNFLREKGLKYIQEMSGNVWTDYNLHDPGVTILDQLCYALTDLGYRAGFSIETILKDKHGKVDAKKNALFPPHSIFCTHPVTIIDFRKLLLNKISLLRNIWLYPVKDKLTGQLTGLYDIDLMLHEDLEMYTQPTIYNSISDEYYSVLDSSKNKIPKDDFFYKTIDVIKNEFENNINLCEGINNIRILKGKDISFNIEIELFEKQNEIDTLAQALFELEKYLKPPIKFYSLEEMIKFGMSLEKIYNGPKIQRGFIRDEELKPKRSAINSDDIIHIISQVPNIERITLFEMSEFTEEPMEDFKTHSKTKNLSKEIIHIKDGYYPRVNLKFNDSLDLSPNINMIYKGSSISFDKSQINDLIRQLWHRNFRRRESEIFSNDLQINPKNNIVSNKSTLKKYTSIRNSFPLTYGISSSGLSQKVSKNRKAEANQLKSYLLIFEQMLANYLAQLSNMDEFFSAKFNPDNLETYFTQTLSNIHDIEEFYSDELKAYPIIKDNDSFESSIESTYIKGLRAIIESTQTALNRKERVLDHLLSRFNERFSDIFKPIHNEIIGDLDHIEDLSRIKSKSVLLSHYDKISYSRFKAKLVSENNKWDNSSGYEVYCKLLLQIPFHNSNLSEALKEILTKSRKDKKADIEFKITESKQKDLVSFKSKYIPFSENELEIKKDSNDEKIVYPKFVKNINFGRVDLKSILFFGTDPKSYFLKKIISKGEEKFEIIFKKAENNYVQIDDNSELDEARSKINALINTFSEIDEKSEGFYVLEHLKFRKVLNQNRFGFQIIDGTKQCVFEVESFDSIEDRNDYLIPLLNQKNLAENPKELIKEIDKYSAGNDIENKHILSQFEVLSHFNSNSRLDSKIKLAQLEKHRFTGVLNGLNQDRHIPILRLIRIMEDGYKIFEDFFYLQISVMIPSWPKRFKQPEFKEEISKTLIQNLPTHLKLNIHWLDVADMIRFENLNDVYNQALQKVPERAHTEIAPKLVRFIQELTENKS